MTIEEALALREGDYVTHPTHTLFVDDQGGGSARIPLPLRITKVWQNDRRKYSQIVQPWQFGHGETKATCLWLKNLPKLTPTNIVDGREARIHKLPPSADRWKLRSITYQGIADAMAAQWSVLPHLNRAAA